MNIQPFLDEQNNSDSSDSFQLLSYDDHSSSQTHQKSKKKLRTQKEHQAKIKELKKDLHEAKKKIQKYEQEFKIIPSSKAYPEVDHAQYEKVVKQNKQLRKGMDNLYEEIGDLEDNKQALEGKIMDQRDKIKSLEEENHRLQNLLRISHQFSRFDYSEKQFENLIKKKEENLRQLIILVLELTQNKENAEKLMKPDNYNSLIKDLKNFRTSLERKFKKSFQRNQTKDNSREYEDHSYYD